MRGGNSTKANILVTRSILPATVLISGECCRICVPLLISRRGKRTILSLVLSTKALEPCWNRSALDKGSMHEVLSSPWDAALEPSRFPLSDHPAPEIASEGTLPNSECACEILRGDSVRHVE